jgi:glutamine synthetase
MEIMKQVALRHGLVCLLHEKPFAGVNGSGKHNNWSLNTNTGVNLLSPGETPYENAQFLLFLVAVVKAVDDYQDLLRVSVATASNDLRLGGNEAPPAIISVYLGSELTAILESIELGIPYNATIKGKIQLGTSVLPPLPLDTTDRNRTSPFAFTGNKFEFRMLGSSDSIACANIMLNTAVAESLRQFADVLEGASDFKAALNDLIRDTFSKHKRIIFNGNGYDDAWVKEAVENRGLLNLKTTPDCMPYLISKKNLDMLVSHNVYSSEELHSRYEILLTNYCKVIKIEALTMLDMTRRHILPAIGAYVSEIASMAAAKMAVSGNIDCSYEKSLLERLSALMSIISSRAEELEEKVNKVHGIQDVTEQSYGYRDLVIPKMSELRAAVDEAELITAEKHWPFPSYGDLLYSVR